MIKCIKCIFWDYLSIMMTISDFKKKIHQGIMISPKLVESVQVKYIWRAFIACLLTALRAPGRPGARLTAGTNPAGPVCFSWLISPLLAQLMFNHCYMNAEYKKVPFICSLCFCFGDVSNPCLAWGDWG